MKYIINENNTCGAASLSDEKRNALLESLGYSIPVSDLEATAAPAEEVDTNEYVQQDAPALYEWDSSVFAMSDEVFEIEGDLFVSVEELDSDTTSQLDESHADLFINNVTFEDSEFSLGDVYELDGQVYVKLDEAYAMKEGDKKGDKSKDKPDDKPDYTTDAREGDEGHGKDKKDKPDFTTGMRKGDKSNQKSKKGDKPDFTTDMRKGDKSKTHPGRKDFEKK